MMKKYYSLLVLFILVTQMLFAQSSGENMLKSLQEKFNTIQTITADFKQLVNGKINLSGKFYYEKKNKLRLELKNVIIVSDGETNWSFNKRENKVVISDYDKDNPPVFSIDKFIESYPAQCVVSAAAEGNEKILVLTAKTAAMNFKTVKIWMNKEDLIEKLAIDSGGKNIEMLFNDYKINEKFGSNKFSFTPPKGSTIVDLR